MNMLQREWNSFRVAGKGLWHLFRTEKHVYFHLFASLSAITLGIILRLSLVEWSIVFLTIGLVICTEAINTAIEAWVDLLIHEHHQKAGAVKDLAAGAVLFASVVAVAVGLLIYLPKILELF
jgi:undecaprenol kinase/diacylglycerol kinase (ATP)